MMLRAVFFDLFSTLAAARYASGGNEYDVLGLTRSEWTRYVEDKTLYTYRALGRVRSEEEIIQRVADIIPFPVTAAQRRQVLEIRRGRMGRAVTHPPEEILPVLETLRGCGLRLGLISNADLIDCHFWGDSPLRPLLDETVFSCDVGFLKPDVRIYRLAMERMGVSPGESVFVGDGGSDELAGARRAGMRTVLTEYLSRKPEETRQKLLGDADACITHFSALPEVLSALDVVPAESAV